MKKNENIEKYPAFFSKKERIVPNKNNKKNWLDTIPESPSSNAGVQTWLKMEKNNRRKVDEMKKINQATPPLPPRTYKKNKP